MEEVFHTIRAQGITFTSEQWGEYCKETRKDSSKLITTKIGKYVFNDFDICLNPERDDIIVKDGSYGYKVSIKYADCGNGLWSFGLDYNVGTAGGGFGVSWVDKDTGDGCFRGYRTKVECLDAACERVEMCVMSCGGKNNKIALALIEKIKAYRKELKRPKIVQLELFEL